MRDTDQFIIRQNPQNSAAVYTVTATLSTIFQVREKPRLIHSSGKPRMAVTRNSSPRMNQGRSSSDLPTAAPVAGAVGRRLPGLAQRVSLATVAFPQRLQILADGGNSAPHAGQTIVSTSLDSMTETAILCRRVGGDMPRNRSRHGTLP